MRHELIGHLGGESRLKSPTDVDALELRAFMLRVHSELCSLASYVSSLSIGLRAHGNVFARCHRHGACDQTCNAGDEDTLTRCLRSGDPEHQAGGGNNSVISA
jgi:hypothetical protein